MIIGNQCNIIMSSNEVHFLQIINPIILSLFEQKKIKLRLLMHLTSATWPPMNLAWRLSYLSWQPSSLGMPILVVQ